MNCFKTFFLLIVSIIVNAETFDKSLFDSQQWLASPELSYPFTQIPATETDIEFYKKLKLDDRYTGFTRIATNRFKFLSSRENVSLQSYIDKTVFKILSTPTGNEICSLLATQGAGFLEYALGVSPPMAIRLYYSCPTEKQKLLPYDMQKKREYVFLYTLDAEPPLEGWTTNQNVTYIFLRNEDFNDNFLTTVLIHEIAIKMDLKEQWAWSGNLYDFNLDQVFYTGDKPCEVLATIRHPLIKYAFNSLRATVIEDKILSELGIRRKSLSSGFEKSCIKPVLELIPSLLRLAAIFRAELKLSILQSSQCSGQNGLKLADLFATLQNEEVIESKTGNRISLCKYLSEPAIGTYIISPTMGGPRPRIGPWSETHTSIINVATKEQAAQELISKILLNPYELRTQSSRDQALESILQHDKRLQSLKPQN